MKKLITVILILSLLLPAAASADSMAGCWAFWMPKSATMGKSNLSLILVLNESGTFSMLSIADIDSGQNVETITGKWEYDGSVVTVHNDDGPTGQFEYKDGMIWVDMGKQVIGLVKTADFQLNQIVYK